jgi:hypothetical protein
MFSHELFPSGSLLLWTPSPLFFINYKATYKIPETYKSDLPILTTSNSVVGDSTRLCYPAHVSSVSVVRPCVPSSPHRPLFHGGGVLVCNEYHHQLQGIDLQACPGSTVYSPLPRSSQVPSPYRGLFQQDKVDPSPKLRSFLILCRIKNVRSVSSTPLYFIELYIYTVPIPRSVSSATLNLCP